MTLIEEVAVMPQYVYEILELGASDDVAELFVDLAAQPNILRDPCSRENICFKHKQAFKILGPRCTYLDIGWPWPRSPGPLPLLE